MESFNEKYPKVTVITPTTYDREEMNNLSRVMIEKQDYKGDIEHLFCFDTGSVGFKRNYLCDNAKGDIIIHADSDDIYAPDWITKSVEHLINTKSDLAGLSHANFTDGVNSWRYTYRWAQPYILGATMCYWRKTWERNKFPDKNVGEDASFCANAGIITPHYYIDGFTATIHPNNTAKKSLNNPKIYKPI